MHSSTPIYSAMKEYLAENNLRLHMPGHIGGKGIKAEELKAVAGIDLSEVPGMDDLHLPLDIIEKGRILLARAFGAQESFFLVNGATSGIHSLFMGLGRSDSKVLVPRNAHRSVFGGMVLSGAVPVYIPCQLQEELGIALAVKNEDIADLLLKHPDVEAIFVTSPSYFGTTCHIEQLSEIGKKAGKVLMVDEAHGGHFSFHRSFPRTALQCGAHAVVNGLHKTLPVLNQGACLHLARDFPGREQVFSAYSLLTTTSPSYPIIASIDLAREMMMQEGEVLLEKALNFSYKYREKINKIKGIRCYGEELKNFPGVCEIDPLKILVSVKELGIDGIKVSQLLRYNYNIQVELEDTHIILAMMSMFHGLNDWERLYQALKDIAALYPANEKRCSSIEIPPNPIVSLSPRKAFFSRKKKAAFSECKAMIAGELIAAYPPGIPCLLPGELISAEIFSYLQYLKKSGLRLQGPQDPSLEYINVID